MTSVSPAGEGRRPSEVGPRQRSASTVISVWTLGSLLMAQGKPEAAEPMLREAVTGFHEKLGPDHSDTRGANGHLRKCLEDQGKRT